ncbi:hypothetical protein EJB05_54202 [Eragrostis curvula]|uniref:KIB1-4 beta-propeller domain-containing protein n=1 Tax=Eragrostis curvula TaxID=38414 RepID=A0A5J9SN35_9POAL|nr:hypothetical protein EJB05_54202 [Eragrostis curvula]
MDSGAGTSRDVLDGRLDKRSRYESDTEASPWAGIQPEIMGIVLRFLICVADRASVRFSCLSQEGTLRPAWRLLIPDEVATDDVRCVDSFDGWLVVATRSKKYNDADGDCFLVNSSSHAVVHLPHLCYSHHNYSAISFKTLPIINGFGEVHFTITDLYRMSLSKVVLSASPDLGSNFTVAASSDFMSSPSLALWQPGMMSWHICNGVAIDGPKDITFYQGKLYVIQRFTTSLCAFVLEEENGGIIISCVEHCVTETLPPHPTQHDGSLTCNMVVWHEKLLLVVRYYDSCYRRSVLKVKVFALDFSTNPHGLTEMHDLDGDCIFVGSGSSKSFPASLLGEAEGDLIYFVPDVWSHDRCVYNMRNDRMRPFVIKSLPSKSQLPDEYNDFPVWLFPSEQREI